MMPESCSEVSDDSQNLFFACGVIQLCLKLVELFIFGLQV